jgi:hypothetical protein
MDSARTLVALHAEKLDLIMQPSKAAPGGGSAEAAARSLAQLQSLISAQLQVGPGGGGGGGRPGTAPLPTAVRRRPL